MIVTFFMECRKSFLFVLNLFKILINQVTLLCRPCILYNQLACIIVKRRAGPRNQIISYTQEHQLGSRYSQAYKENDCDVKSNLSARLLTGKIQYTWFQNYNEKNNEKKQNDFYKIIFGIWLGICKNLIFLIPRTIGQNRDGNYRINLLEML